MQMCVISISIIPVHMLKIMFIKWEKQKDKHSLANY